MLGMLAPVMAPVMQWMAATDKRLERMEALLQALDGRAKVMLDLLQSLPK
jgi:hypothetical protein